MLWKRVILAVLVSLSVAFQAAPTASRSIDDDWALVNSCEKLQSFKVRYGSASRFAGYYAKRARDLKCPAPTPPKPQIKIPPNLSVKPPRKLPPRAPIYKPLPLEIIVDQAGRGNTTSLAAAIDVIPEGGVITVYPGTYTEKILINRSVTIRGVKDATTGQYPVIQASSTTPVGTVSIVSGDVRLESLTLRATGSVPLALLVKGGSLSALQIKTEWKPQPQGLAASGFGTVQIETSAKVVLNRLDVGAGGQAAIVALGAKNLTINDSIIRNPNGTGLVGSNADIWVNRSSFETPTWAVFVQGASSASLEDVVLRSGTGAAPEGLAAEGTSTISMHSGIICVGANQSWSLANPPATITSINVYNALGDLISPTRGKVDYSGFAKTYCSGKAPGISPY